MSLKDALLQTEEVRFGKNVFNVRGLSLTDISILTGFYKPVLSQVFDQFAAIDPAGNIRVEPEVGTEFAMEIVMKFPALVAHTIALAEDRPDGEDPQIAMAARLPVDVSTDALVKIMKLTFQTEGGAKKVLETFIQAFVGMTKFATGQKT